MTNVHVAILFQATAHSRRCAFCAAPVVKVVLLRRAACVSLRFTRGRQPKEAGALRVQVKNGGVLEVGGDVLVGGTLVPKTSRWTRWRTACLMI